MDEYAKKIFKGRCPYTDKGCTEFNCKQCKVEKEEIEAMKQFDEEELYDQN